MSSTAIPYTKESVAAHWVVSCSPSIEVHFSEGQYLCDLSKDGTKILAAYGPMFPHSKMAVLDAETGTLLVKFGSPTSRRGFLRTSCVMAADGQKCLSSLEENIELWDTFSGEQTACLSSPDTYVHNTCFGNNKNRIASCHSDFVARVWDIGSESPRMSESFRHPHRINSIQLSDDDQLLYAACGDKILRVWDVRSRGDAFNLHGHNAPVCDCSISTNGSTLVSCSKDGTVCVWDARKRESLNKRQIDIHEYRNYKRYSCGISSDGSMVVASGGSNSVFFYVNHSNTIMQLDNASVEVPSCAISGAGRRVVTSSRDGFLRVYDASFYKSLPTDFGKVTEISQDPLTMLESPSFAPHGSRSLAVSECDMNNVTENISQSISANFQKCSGSTEKAQADDKEAKLLVEDNAPGIEESPENHIETTKRQKNRIYADPEERRNVVEGLVVTQVADLMSRFACDRLCGEDVIELRDQVRENVTQRKMSGRGLMSSFIKQELVARTVLYGDSEDVKGLETDFLYLELSDFVRKLRNGEVDISSTII